MHIQFNKTKIIATVGPATSSREMLRELVLSGVDVFRLNFSHSTHEEHQKVVDYVRDINTELNTHVSLLLDLQGPKIRIGEVMPGSVVEEGQNLIITTEELVGDTSRVSTNYTPLPSEVSVGETILIDDGKIELKISTIEGTEITTDVVTSGELKSRKGMNLPQTNVSVPSLTAKDKADLEFGIQNDFEWVALSFVRTAADVSDLKKIIADSGKFIKVVAKVEKPEAIKNIDGIIAESDAVMVARGDLGVEIPMEEVPVCQKRIVELCNQAYKPVIIATQMMESMINNPRPTRAETNDVANAVMDGADALMLSAETAVGKYPVKVIDSMVKTITAVESQEKLYYRFYETDRSSPIFYNDSLLVSAVRLAKEVNAKAITGMTVSGYTAFKMASYRPKTPIFIFTENHKLLNTISLIWGVRGFYYDKSESTDNTIADIEELLKEKGHITAGDVIVNTASMPIHSRGRTNTLKITVAN